MNSLRFLESQIGRRIAPGDILIRKDEIPGSDPDYLLVWEVQDDDITVVEMTPFGPDSTSLNKLIVDPHNHDTFGIVKREDRIK